MQNNWWVQTSQTQSEREAHSLPHSKGLVLITNGNNCYMLLCPLIHPLVLSCYCCCQVLLSTDSALQVSGLECLHSLVHHWPSYRATLLREDTAELLFEAMKTKNESVLR